MTAAGAAPPLPTFQRDAYLAALTPPTLDLGGGRVLTGRILSADEWFAFEDRLALAAKGQLTTAGLRALMVEMTDVVFPTVEEERTERRWLFWRRRRVVAVRPSESLRQLPWGAQLAQFEAFTLAQAEAQKGPTTHRATKSNRPARTNGTPSRG